MPRLTIPPDVLAAEPWLQALVMPTDTSVDDVRKRARKATYGEIIRRRLASDQHLRIRSTSGSIRRTEYEPEIVVAHGNEVVTRAVGGAQ